MRLLLVLFLFINIFLAKTYAQTKNSVIDSIIVLQKLSTDNSLNLDKRLKYSKLAFEESREINNDSLLLKSGKNLSTAYLYMDEYELYRDINHFNLKLAYKIKDTSVIAYANYNLGWYHQTELHNDSAFYYYYAAAKTYNYLKQVQNEGEVLLNLANIQETEKDYVGCEYTVFQSIKLIQTLPQTENNLDTLWSLHNLIGLVSMELGLYNKALEYHKKALSFSDKMEDDFINRLLSLNNLGLIYRKKGEYQEALKYYNDVLSKNDLLDLDPETYALFLNNLAYTEFLSGSKDDKRLIKLFKECYTISDSLNLDIRKLYSTFNLSQFYFSREDFNKAEKYSNEAYRIARRTHSNDVVLDILKLKSDISEGEKGKKYLEEYITLNDSLLTKERNFSNKSSMIRYETDQIKAENLEITRRNQWLIAISGGLLLTFLLVYIIVNQQAKNKELKFVQQQQEANEEIYNLMLAQQDKMEEGRAKEKVRISEELHDGVLSRLFGTRLSLDSINMVNTNEAIKSRSNYISELKTIEQEIRKISHDLNTDFIADSGFLDIIETLVENQCKAYELTYEFDHSEVIDWDEISNKNKIHLYRIIQESLQNIYKHAKATDVKISFQLKKDVILLSIIDNGSGFEINKARKGIGLKNINSRVAELKGKLTIDSQIGKGTDILINVPI